MRFHLVEFVMTDLCWLLFVRFGCCRSAQTGNEMTRETLGHRFYRLVDKEEHEPATRTELSHRDTKCAHQQCRARDSRWRDSLATAPGKTN